MDNSKSGLFVIKDKARKKLGIFVYGYRNEKDKAHDFFQENGFDHGYVICQYNDKGNHYLSYLKNNLYNMWKLKGYDVFCNKQCKPYITNIPFAYLIDKPGTLKILNTSTNSYIEMNVRGYDITQIGNRVNKASFLKYGWDYFSKDVYIVCLANDSNGFNKIHMPEPSSEILLKEKKVNLPLGLEKPELTIKEKPELTIKEKLDFLAKQYNATCEEVLTDLVDEAFNFEKNDNKDNKDKKVTS